MTGVPISETSASQRWGQGLFSAEELAVYDHYRRAGRTPFPWDACALLIVDVTESFVGPKLPTLEASALMRTACGLPGWDALPVIRRLQDAFRAARRPILYTVPSRESEMFVGGTTIGGTAGPVDDSIPALVAPTVDEPVFRKPKASAFYGVPLAAYLVRKGVRGIVLAGATTSGCVRASTIDASSAGYEVALVADACFDRSPLSHAVAVFELDVKYATAMLSTEVLPNVRAR